MEIKDEYYIKKILKEMSGISELELSFIMKAFKKTIIYFIENGVEFFIKDFFKFHKYTRKAQKLYVRYRNEYDDIPEYDICKFTTYDNLRDYLNNRNKYKDVRHRERLPDGEIRIKKIG